MQSDPYAVVVVITGYPSLSSAVEVMKAGAYDFLPKPFKAEELRLATRRALEKRRLALAVAAGERDKQRMRDNFVAMVSHQLKSPAACVKECLDVALSSFAGKLPPQCARLLEGADAKAELLLRLMDDWLTLDRAESGGVEIGSEPADLVPILRAVIAAAEERAAREDVKVQLHCSGGPAQLRMDAQALREVFVNLLDNALSYTSAGGKVEVSVESQQEAALVSVTDTGPGIPPEEQGLVFEPFFRGKHAEKMHGTGLGLAIVRQIVEAHKGHVSVQSEPQCGTTFRVYLPKGQERQ
jgi:signal transduction histidine kinase